MEISELTKAMHDFVEEKGWYATGSLRPQTPRNIAISLSLLQLASLTEIDLEAAILQKLTKNYTRSWDEDRLK